jgi:uncharacterized membrane protein YeaQ/YmgE (transglycosylase-associated protein family)
MASGEFLNPRKPTPAHRTTSKTPGQSHPYRVSFQLLLRKVNASGASGREESSMHVLWWIIVGLIAGWATGKIMKGSGYGVLMDIVLGIVGAIVGGWIMRALGFAGQGGTIYTILVAIGGAVILTWLFRLVTGRGRGTGEGGMRKVA